MVRPLLLFLACWLVLSACAAPGDEGAESDASRPDPPRSQRPVAYLDGRPIHMDELRPALFEAAGAAVLADHVLDRQVARALAAEDIELTEQHIQAEREHLARSLSESGDAFEQRAAADPDRLLHELRRRRNLGRERFAALLRRNAGLRLLVQDQIQIEPASLQRAYERTYGPQYVARVIVVDDLDQAGDLRQRVLDGEPLAALAVEASTDPSAARGGLVGPVSAADGEFPLAARQALAELAEREGEGGLSEVVVLPGGYALFQLERKIERRNVEFDDVEESLRQQVRRRLERLRMEQLARRLLEQDEVAVRDRHLRESWNNE